MAGRPPPSSASYSRFLSRPRKTPKGEAALSNAFLLRLATGCFVVGACMELFMIHTGFYDKVTAIEAERRRDAEEYAQQNAWVKDMLKDHSQRSK